MNQFKDRWGQLVKKHITLASEKGLSVKKNQLSEGWCITLPNGAVHNEPTPSGLCKYVRDY